MRRKPRHIEDSIQCAVANQLRARAMPGVVWWHTPNGAKLGGSPLQGARLKRAGVRAGVSDIIALHRGKLYALELKAIGGRATEAQMRFMSEVNDAGGYATIAIGIDEAIRCLEIWGILRRAIQ